MSFFSKVASATRDNQHIANGVSAVSEILDGYDADNDVNALILAAYITRLSVLDTFEKSGYNVLYTCFSYIDGELTQISWLQANLMTYGRISDLIEDADLETKKLIESILDRGEAFEIIDRRTPYEVKQRYID